MRTPEQIVEALLEQSGRASRALSPQELGRWLASVNAHDLAGPLSPKQIMWIARHGKQWTLVDFPVSNWHDSAPGADPGAPLDQPIVIAVVDGEVKILDGQHRYSKANREGVKTLPAYVPVEHLLLLNEDEDDLRADVDRIPERPTARWPFTATELLDPSGTAQTDWLAANATTPDDPDNLIVIQIQRNLNPENKAREMDIDYDSIFDPYNGDEIVWRDVFVNPDGTFGGFADDFT